MDSVDGYGCVDEVGDVIGCCLVKMWGCWIASAY